MPDPVEWGTEPPLDPKGIGGLRGGYMAMLRRARRVGAAHFIPHLRQGFHPLRRQAHILS
jgi:hypothetical protein